MIYKICNEKEEEKSISNKIYLQIMNDSLSCSATCIQVICCMYAQIHLHIIGNNLSVIKFIQIYF